MLIRIRGILPKWLYDNSYFEVNELLRYITITLSQILMGLDNGFMLFYGVFTYQRYGTFLIRDAWLYEGILLPNFGGIVMPHNEWAIN